MTTLEVGKKLVALCNQNKNMEAVNTLYDAKIVTIEPHDMPGMPARQEGIEAVRKKTEWWFANHQIHSSTAEGPWPLGDKFIVHFKIDVTPTAGPMKGQRMKMEEAGLYTVKNGKVVQEEFFYAME